MQKINLRSHAGVVPACIATKVKRDIQTPTMTVQAMELLDWNRDVPLTERKKEEIRCSIIARYRTRADEIWQLESGVLLLGGWDSRLSRDEVTLIKRIGVGGESMLAKKTIREIKQEMKVPLSKVLDLLAKIESSYWGEYTKDLSPKERTRSSDSDDTKTVEINMALREMGQQVKALMWTQKIAPTDLRFGYPGPDPFHQWLDEKLSKQTTQLKVISLLEKIIAANAKTAEEEVKDITEHMADEYGPKQPDQRRKAIDVYLSRVLTKTGGGAKLHEIGEKYGFTRQRAEQICKRFESRLEELQVQTPAIERVLHAAARIAPSSEQEINDQLRRFIGQGAGIESLNTWFEKLADKKSPLKNERLNQLVRGHLTDVTMYSKTETSPWVKALVHHAGRDSQLLGCSNVLRIAGRLAIKENIAPGQEAIESALESAPGFRWLDKETGWFTCFDGQESGLGNRVKKIMAVATESTGADEIAAAIASDDQMLYRDTVTQGLATPPVHVIRELLKGWPWLRIHQKGRFLPNEFFDKEKALTEVETAIVEEICARGGIACRGELRDIVVDEMGLTDMLLSSVLGSSPIFIKFEHGLYGVRGRRQENDALSNARSRTRARAREIGEETRHPLTRSNEFAVRITVASLRHEQYGVASIHQEKLIGKTIEAYGDEGIKIGAVKISQTGKITGLNKIFPNAQQGDYYLVAVEGECIRVRLHSSDDEHHGQKKLTH